MSSKSYIPHSVFRSALGVADKMEPLESKKDPVIAAVCGFATGGVGLGLYLRSWQDFFIPWFMLLVLAVIGLPLAELPALCVPVFWAIYGYRRVKASNAKLEGRAGIIDTEVIIEPPPILSVQRAGHNKLQMRLQRLDGLLAEGILSPDEHAARRKQLLNQF